MICPAGGVVVVSGADARMPSERRSSLDLLRIVGALAIVWCHTPQAPGHALGFVGLPIFLVLSFALQGRKPTPQPFAACFIARGQRLLIPWAFWWVVYALPELSVLGGDATPGDLVRPLVILAGPKGHLWYLPFAFVGAMLTWFVIRLTSGVENRYVLPAGLAAGLAAIACEPLIETALQPPFPLHQWTRGAATIPIGFALGRIMQLAASRERTRWIATVGVSTLMVGVWRQLGVGPAPAGSWLSVLGLTYAVAVTAICLGLRFDLPRHPVVTRLAELTLGIYLAHPLVWSVLSKLGIPLPYPVLTAAVGFAGATAAAYVLKRLPLLNRFV